MADQIRELPFSYFFSSFPFDLLSVFKCKAETCGTPSLERDHAGSCEAVFEVSHKPAFGSRRPLGTSVGVGKTQVVDYIDLEKAIAAGGKMSQWEPSKWAHMKTLAVAAAGAGSVALMKRESDGQSVAAKVLPLELIRSCPEEFNKYHSDANERPWTDIAIVKHLNSIKFPYTLDLLGLFSGDEKVYIMSSFANRGDLFTWCQEDKSRAGVERETIIRPMLKQLFKAVCWLHNLGIAHRDLSLENVMLTDDAESGLQVKLIDFGMATLSRTAIREVRGKRSYQAPEMHRNDEYDTFLVDNFSVGVISYCMAVHYYPWESTRPRKDRSFEVAQTLGLETFMRKKRMPCNKRPIAEVVSKPVLELICGLMSFNPETRYSLGEACFEKTKLRRKGSKASVASQISSVSTTASLGNLSDKDSDSDSSADAVSKYHCHSRASIWDCEWLSEQDAPLR